MDCAEAVNEVGAVDSNDPAVWKLSLNNIQGPFVILMAEDRRQHYFVAYVEVCIAGRQPST